MSRIFLNCLFILSFCFLSCENKEKGAKKGITAAFNNYKQGLLRGDPDLSVNQLSSRTVAYYDDLSQVIKRADSVEISTLGYVKRTLALTVLAKAPDETVILDGRRLFKYLLSIELVEKDRLMDIEISTVKVNNDFGIGYVTSPALRNLAASAGNGKNLPLYFEFYKEKDRWKLDLMELMLRADKVYARQIDSINRFENLDEIIYLQTGSYPKYK